jgi:hypothetical protein
VRRFNRRLAAATTAFTVATLDMPTPAQADQASVRSAYDGIARQAANKMVALDTGSARDE